MLCDMRRVGRRWRILGRLICTCASYIVQVVDWVMTVEAHDGGMKGGRQACNGGEVGKRGAMSGFDR